VLDGEVVRVGEYVETGRIHRGDPAQVDHQSRQFGGDHMPEFAGEGGQGGDIDRPGDPHDRALTDSTPATDKRPACLRRPAGGADHSRFWG
jgi:hypothetical protein